MTPRLTSSAVALVAATVPALADVTPEQAWQSWVDYYEAMGYSVAEGKRDRSGATLTVSEVAITGGSETQRMDISVPQVVLTDIGDGKVRTVFSDRLAATITGTNQDDKPYTLPVTIEMPGNSTTTSGAPEDMTHEFSYPTLNVALTTITTDGMETALPVRFSARDTSGTFHVVPGAPANYDYTMTSAGATFDGRVTGEKAETANFSGSIDQIGTSGQIVAPGGMTSIEEDLNAALKAGLVMRGSVQGGALSASFEFSGMSGEGQTESGAGSIDSKGIDFSFDMSRTGLVYQAASEASSFQLTTSDLPFPISYALESGGFDFQIPVMQSDAAQPFKFNYSLTGLTLGDAIWNLFDAQGQLPRDPASLDIDITGTMQVLSDLFAPERLNLSPVGDTDAATAGGTAPDAPADQAEAMAENDADTPPDPFKAVEVTINQIALNALGASINATGRLTAPENGAMTQPVGEVHASYEGLNGLIDKLAGMGLIPEDKVMSVRMMLMMFTKPVGEGQDRMETRLEFKEGGTILANGQQIK